MRDYKARIEIIERTNLRVDLHREYTKKNLRSIAVSRLSLQLWLKDGCGAPERNVQKITKIRDWQRRPIG